MSGRNGARHGIAVRDFDALFRDRPDDGGYAVHRDLFRDPALFELELEYLFESNWVFLAHESQIRHPHDFYATTMGRQPVLLMRGGDGVLRCFLNSCAHKGAAVCTEDWGNRQRFVCPYHGWVYDSIGANVHVRNERTGFYPAGFADSYRGLTPVARLDSYRGFVFASLEEAVPSLAEHLGDARFFIDLVVDQAGPRGMEALPGMCCYTFDGNWKMQIENAVDGYHVAHLHSTLSRIVSERRQGQRGEDKVRGVDLTGTFEKPMINGTYAFANGHHAAWHDNPDPENRPYYDGLDGLKRRVDATKAEWIVRNRNLNIYPNLTVADMISLQIRVIRPLSVDRSEMRSFCFGAVGEPDAVRDRRLRQFEDFYNPSGLAVPDDNRAFELVQRGYGARELDWLPLAYQRGSQVVKSGPDEYAIAVGIHPLSTSSRPDGHHQDETLFRQVFREWAKLMKSGQSRALARATA